MKKLLLLVMLALSSITHLFANELPFGLSKDMSTIEVKAKLREKSFLTLNDTFSKLGKDGEVLNYDVSGLDFKGVTIDDLWISWYKNEIRAVQFNSRFVSDIDTAFSNLVALKDFFVSQGKKVTVNRLSSLKKGGDLKQSGPVVEFDGKPCSIDIFTSLDDDGDARQKVMYLVTEVATKRTLAIQAEEARKNQRAVDLLK
jgi:hypothetical protein